jgi:hypothetical protein
MVHPVALLHRLLVARPVAHPEHLLVLVARPDLEKGLL